MIDRMKAEKSFEQFLSNYDLEDPKIRLKLTHTYRVARLSEKIAQSLGLSEDDVSLAWLCGMLHDLGRFEQARRFDSFLDAKTIDHAALSEELLFDESGGRPLIRRFFDSSEYDSIIQAAVAHHSDFRLPETLDERTLLFCNILRDADKVDILKVNVVDPPEAIYNVSEAEMEASPVSDESLRGFYEHRTLTRDERTYPADFVVSHICFVYELVYPETLRLALEQGYLLKMLRRPFTNQNTAEKFQLMEHHLQIWLEDRGLSF